MPRFAFLTAPTNEASRTLTPGTDITTTGQALNELAVPITIKERGLVTPVAIASFTQVRSVTDLIAIAQRNLARDYNNWVDNVIRNLYLTTTSIKYPNGETASTIDTTDTFDYKFLTYMAKVMYENKVPMFPTGRWAIALNPTDWMNLVNSLQADGNKTLANDVDNINRLLFPAGQGQVTGYSSTPACTSPLAAATHARSAAR